jgi:dihydrolipoamide dehydrogenase
VSLVDVRVPDIGEFENVDVIELLVAPGDRVAVDQSLITLESDKATMEIPSPAAGVVRELLVQVGSQVSQGDPILRLEADATAGAEPPRAAREERAAPPAPQPVQPAARVELPAADLRAGVLVLGSGPGGYTAAFRAADLGQQVVLVERYPVLGGVCLNVGCIPSKTLLHLAEVVVEARDLARHGVEFGAPRLDLAKIRAFKTQVVGKLTGGLDGLARRRKVQVVQGEGRFAGPNLLRVEAPGGGATAIAFEHAIVAVGSRAVRLPGFPDDPRIMDSTDALELAEVPERLLVVGGGIIGLELAAVFHALGSRVSVVELERQLMPGTDADLVKILHKLIAARYAGIFTGTKVTGVEARGDGLHVSFEGEGAPARDVFDRLLVAVGRRPNGDRIGAEAAGLAVDARGFVLVDAQLRTNLSHVFAIGDVAGPPLLAHKATHQGKTAAEVIAGRKVAFEPRAIPSVAYTDPEVAWVGLTETEARARNVEVRRVAFPWQASARALGIGRAEGVTKLLVEPASNRLLGAGIVGRNAGELISELALAIEMGADAEDVALTIHPHPTLSETLAFAAELAEGTITDLYAPKR